MSEIVSLGQHFNKGQRLFRLLENSELSTIDTKYQKQVTDCSEIFTSCLQQVRKAGVFSSNETLEDMKTSDLKYFLLEYYLGELSLKTVGPERFVLVEKAKSHFEEFLELCEVYELLSKEDKKYYSEQSKQVKKDPSKKREEKIARYKREQETKSKLEELESLLSLEEDESLAEASDMEDTIRESFLTLIDLCIQKTLEQYVSIQQEEEMLLQMKQMHLRNGEQSQRDIDEASELRLDQPLNRDGPILSKEGQPLRPFIITNQRKALQDQVFRPGWRLPTMSIDEYLQQEMDRGNFISGGGKTPEKVEIDDNDEAALDAETYKAREWDDFTDANPRGWGNQGVNRG
ncbi:Type 2A phosphatase-associated protein 42 [Basidiobolus ranarum]|uniref:Type 2A phosphatase-associated protein 42 n=1 Tax=Basidiobolus ranarum TaxID=34480 RepID=A0ABR2VX73_9FUNG